jgi:hypothetical protein
LRKRTRHSRRAHPGPGVLLLLRRGADALSAAKPDYRKGQKKSNPVQGTNYVHSDCGGAFHQTAGLSELAPDASQFNALDLFNPG